MSNYQPYGTPTPEQAEEIKKQFEDYRKYKEENKGSWRSDGMNYGFRHPQTGEVIASSHPQYAELKSKLGY